MAKGLDYDALFPGRFLKAGEFNGKDVTLTIASIELEELPQEQGGTKVRGILGFQKTKKKLVLNRTNGEAIKALFGRDTGEWIGKRVTFYPAAFSFGDNDFAIRVRGSPDIAGPVKFTLKLPRKKPSDVTLLPTGNGAAKQEQKPAEALVEAVVEGQDDIQF